ncbi:MAG: cell wall hydrolase, partial [Candidatus Aenigmatarchaeota archaeon]
MNFGKSISLKVIFPLILILQLVFAGCSNYNSPYSLHPTGNCYQFYDQYIRNTGISINTWNEFEKVVFIESAYYTDGGEQNRQKIALGIAATILNRVESGRFSDANGSIDNKLWDVLFAPHQFSPVSLHPDWFGNGVCIENSPFMFDSNGVPLSYRFERLSSFRQVLLSALSGVDPTGGALYFKVPEVSLQWPCETGICDCGKVDLGGRTIFYR